MSSSPVAGVETAVIHWLREDPGGPILSPGCPELGVPAARHSVACWRARPTVKNIHVTSLPCVVSCPRCRSRKEFLALPEFVREQGRPAWARGETADSALADIDGEGK